MSSIHPHGGGGGGGVNNNSIQNNNHNNTSVDNNNTSQFELDSYEAGLSLHETVLKMCRDTGLENLARDSGLIQNNEIPSIRYMNGSGVNSPPNNYNLSQHSPFRNDNTSTTSTTSSTATTTTSNVPIIPQSSTLGDYYLMNDLRGNNFKPTTTTVNNNSSTGTTSTTSTTSTTTTTSSSFKSRMGSRQNNKSAAAQSEDQHNTSFNSELHDGFNHLFETQSQNMEEDSKKRKGKEDKSKGLSYLSQKVCQKVQSKKTTSYVEVSNEIIEEYIKENVKNGTNEADLKTNTMKRRIYDVLNVFQAMNIISKDKQKISWIGLPNSSTPTNSVASLERQKQEVQARLKSKKQSLKELVHLEKVYQSLITRNQGIVQQQQQQQQTVEVENDRIHLPFIVVNTKYSTVINCEVESDRSKYFFNFSQPFEIHDDSELIKKLSFVPPPNVKYNNYNSSNGNGNTSTHYKKKRKKDDDTDVQSETDG